MLCRLLILDPLPSFPFPSLPLVEQVEQVERVKRGRVIDTWYQLRYVSSAVLTKYRIDGMS